MAERKIFAGPRLRRMRNALELTQADMAQKLGISPSYLNLIERNQRPLTVQVLLKLSSTFDIDIAELQAESSGEVLDALRAAFADPLLSAELPSPGELTEVADAAPNLARGVAHLYDAYRESCERLSELSAQMANRGGDVSEAAARLPFDRVGAYFEEAGPWFSELEMESAALAEGLAPRDDILAALKTHLRDALGIDTRILPARTLPGERARFDRHSMRLFISETTPLQERSWIVAYQAAMAGHGALLDRLANDCGFADAEALRLLRAGFARRFADALILPANRLEQAAFETGFDLALLAQRFQTRVTRVMERVAALGGQPGSRVAECSLLLTDGAGSTLRRIRGGGFTLARAGAPCARLPVFDLAADARVRAQPLETADGKSFVALCATDSGVAGGSAAPAPRLAAMLVWPQDSAPQLSLVADGRAPRGIGVSCRMCERSGCAQRTQPPATRPAAFLDYVLALSEHEVP